MRTPGIYGMGGGTSIRIGMSPNTMRVAMSPGFTPNIYGDINRFTPEPDR